MALQMLKAPAAASPITTDGQHFFVALGERIEQFRKARGITQAHLAKTSAKQQFVAQVIDSVLAQAQR